MGLSSYERLGQEKHVLFTKQRERLNRRKRKGRGDMKIVEAKVNNKANATFTENNITVIVRVFNVNDHHLADLLARIEQISDRDSLLHAVRMSQCLLCATSSRMYYFDYSCGSLSVTFHPRVRADGLTTC